MTDMVAFQFRQRAGRLNWKQVTAIDLNELVTQVNIHELQNILDPVTFSEISTEDIKTNSVDNINKLIHLLQFMIEYLLNHQETQFALIAKLNNKVSKLQKSRERYHQENVCFREDVKTYQRQLHLLRKGINQQDPSQPYARLLHDARRDRNSYESEEKKNNNNAIGAHDNSEVIVRTILDHEREARRAMIDLLDEQRRQFSREMTNLVDVLQKPTSCASSTPEPINTDLLMRNLQLQVDRMLSQALDSHKQSLSTLVPAVRTSMATEKDVRSSSNTQDILRQAALEELERQLKFQADDLREREISLRKREESHSRKEAFRKSDELVSKYHNASVRDEAVKRVLGARLLKSVVYGGNSTSDFYLVCLKSLIVFALQLLVGFSIDAFDIGLTS
jgi:uncharacterized phage infection (PIP) family protein YhgE